MLMTLDIELSFKLWCHAHMIQEDITKNGHSNFACPQNRVDSAERSVIYMDFIYSYEKSATIFTLQ